VPAFVDIVDPRRLGVALEPLVDLELLHLFVAGAVDGETMTAQVDGAAGVMQAVVCEASLAIGDDDSI